MTRRFRQRRSRRIARLHRVAGVVCLVGCAVFLWRVAANQLTAGFLDLVLFAPPGAVLGLAATWAAHAFVPGQFSWRRALAGAMVGGLVVSPIVAFLVAFTAAWDHGSFQFVFNLGAWLALAAGVLVGLVGEVSRWVREWRRMRRAAAHNHAPPAPTLTMSDAGNGVHPTARKHARRYSRSKTVPR